MLGIPLATFIFGGMIFGGLYLASLIAVQSLPISAGDRQALVTATDLQRVFPNLVVRTDGETIAKTRYPDGRVALEYGYHHPVSDTEVSLSCSITLEPTRNDARRFYSEQLADARDTISADQSLEWTERDSLFAWGDVWNFASVTKAGQPHGYFFACRQGERVFCVELLGPKPPEQDEFFALFARRVEQMPAYEP